MRQTLNRITFTNQNALMLAPFQNQASHTSHKMYRDIDRLSREQSRNIYRTRSMYAQKRPIQIEEPEQLIKEDFPIILSMRYGNVRKFDLMYRQQAQQAGINRLMYNLFTLGRTFSSAYFLANLLRDRDSSGKTPLHYAAAGGVILDESGIKNRIVLKLMNIQDNHGISALMISCFLGYSQNIKILHQELHLRDNLGRSCIHHAAMGKRPEVVLQLWADLHGSIDEMGRDIWNYITKYGIRSKVERMLTLKVGVDVNGDNWKRKKVDFLGGGIDVISRMEEQQYVSIKFD
ncbi:hypothetical protein SS50377_22597 [Spironucleus salmonicida]|uniref:Ankyrin repeat-containing protein n=1 Tax=Spironucleus salmonicida TaxID=348837 RepID=V6LMH0_9EUKA|nr:hypothetical protein SS50377_22597 [Spironucleus salmonicida]|eukprot:EST41914.1 hypothetical protein SS50377_18218 [Spironucleus salmonicida]